MSDAADLARAIAILTADDPPRVWSLIVTIFGDLAQGESDAMSGRLLARMAEIVGLRPETVRVALHRLRKDGWIQSHRNGRNSRYALTNFGRAQSAAAATRIYARTVPDPGAWTVLIGDPSGSGEALAAEASRTDAVPLGSFGLLVPGTIENCDRSLLRIAADRVDLPHWVRASACPAEVETGYNTLLARLRQIDHLVAAGGSGVEDAVMRALIVHSWRRLLLHHAHLPDSLYPSGFPAPDCRRAVMALLDRLPKPPLDTLEAEAAS